MSVEIAEMKVMHLFQVAGVFSCEFLSAEVVPIYTCSQHVVTSINGTTSIEEISTAKYPNATLPQKHDPLFWNMHTFKINV